MSTPQKIANIIPLVFEQEHQWKYQLLRNWQNIFGNMSDKVYLERINNDTLILAVYDACWMQELYNLSPLLITSINKTLDKPYVKQLRFKRAGVRDTKKSTNQQKAPVKLEPFCLTPREEKILSTIKDRELAQALSNFLARCYREKQLYKNTLPSRLSKI